MSNAKWDLPNPFIHQVVAKPEHIDAFGHVNNAVYNTWLDETAWAHWDSFGFDKKTCALARRGMAVIRAETDYLASAYAGDALDVAVWISASDGRLRAERRYQICRADTGQTIFRSHWKLVCFNLDTGRPARMSKELVAHYVVLDHVRDALNSIENNK
jgi:acyl-CoA thioester hydrolase